MFKRVLFNNSIFYSYNNLLKCPSCTQSVLGAGILRKRVNASLINQLIKVGLCVKVGRNQIESSHESMDVAPVINDSRLIKVAIVGVPNAGKSTVINQLVGQQVCSASSKVHTTRFRVRAAVSEGKTQIVLLDTPGLVGPKQAEMHHLERSFLVDGDLASHEADVICVIHDASNKWTREELDEGVLQLLNKYKHKRSFLVLNKVDLMKSKRKLLDLVRILMCDSEKNSKSWSYFEQTFMISALTGSGIPELKEYLLDISYPSPWLFSPNVTTDQRMESLIEHGVRAALLDNLPQEIPYHIKPQIEHLHIMKDGTIIAVVLIECSLKRVERMVMGAKGWRIRKIAQAAEQQLQSAFNSTVILRLVVTEKKY